MSRWLWLWFGALIQVFPSRRSILLENLAVPTENSICGENTESTILCEIIVVSTMNSFLVALCALIASSFRTRVTLQAEILALRHQLAVLQANAPRRLRLKRSDRLLWVLLSRFWQDWRRCLQIVQPFNPRRSSLGTAELSPGIGPGNHDAALEDRT